VAKRSPILGYNHNFRHRGLVFHVQTEDSGIENPHIFTHLFNGGVILASRKLTYDSGSAEEVVKALMQAQHKAMLKDLRRGSFDDKIDAYFGDDPALEPQTSPEPHDTLTEMSPPDIEELALEDIEIIGPSPHDTLREPPPVAVPSSESVPVVIHAQAPSSAPDPPGAVPRRPGAYAQHRTGAHAAVPEKSEPTKPRTGTVEKVRTPTPSQKLPPQAYEIAADIEASTAPPPNVVVSRPSVIVGAPPKVVGNKQPAAKPAATPATTAPPPSRRARDGSSSLFGKDLISEKSLDEVILAYLSEDGGGRDGGG
jgi:hypothetical protein